MDSTAGDLNVAAKEVGANIEKQLSRDSRDDVSSGKDHVAEKNELGPHSSSGSSSDDIAQLKEVDSHIVKVPEIKEGDEAYAHLPPHERDIVKRQLDIPEVKVTYKTLYRYATRYDLIIIAISAICSIAGGAVMPLMTVSTVSSRFRNVQPAHRTSGTVRSISRRFPRLLPEPNIEFRIQCSIVTLYDLFRLPCDWRVLYHLYLYGWIHLHRRAYCREDP